MKSRDITGQKFGRLTAIKFIERKGPNYYWLFRCDCGTEKIMHKSGVVNGQSKSCGCLHKEIMGKRMEGINNPAWRGKKVGRFALYKWIGIHNNKSGICNICNKESKKTMWVVRKGEEYSRDINNYIELCYKCFRIYKNFIRTSQNGMIMCTRCKQKKKVSEFYKAKKLKNGISSWCKKCYNQYQLEKIRTNPQLKLKNNISKNIRRCLKKRLSSKNGKSTFDFLPYTIGELINHLEKLFQPGMSWDNYGYYGWHIDHIRPDSSFNYTSVEDEEFQKCWALENLQPLWMIDNFKKSNKLNYKVI